MLLDARKILLGKQGPLKNFPSLILWNKGFYPQQAFVCLEYVQNKPSFIILDKYAVLK